MLKNYKPYQMPKFENVLNELDLHHEWNRKESKFFLKHFHL